MGTLVCCYFFITTLFLRGQVLKHILREKNIYFFPQATLLERINWFFVFLFFAFLFSLPLHFARDWRKEFVRHPRRQRLGFVTLCCVYTPSKSKVAQATQSSRRHERPRGGTAPTLRAAAYRPTIDHWRGARRCFACLRQNAFSDLTTLAIFRSISSCVRAAISAFVLRLETKQTRMTCRCSFSLSCFAGSLDVVTLRVYYLLRGE